MKGTGFPSRCNHEDRNEEKREQPLILYKKYLYDNHFDKEQPEEIVPVGATSKSIS